MWMVNVIYCDDQRYYVFVEYIWLRNALVDDGIHWMNTHDHVVCASMLLFMALPIILIMMHVYTIVYDMRVQWYGLDVYTSMRVMLVIYGTHRACRQRYVFRWATRLPTVLVGRVMYFHGSAYICMSLIYTVTYRVLLCYCMHWYTQWHRIQALRIRVYTICVTSSILNKHNHIGMQHNSYCITTIQIIVLSNIQRNVVDKPHTQQYITPTYTTVLITHNMVYCRTSTYITVSAHVIINIVNSTIPVSVYIRNTWNRANKHNTSHCIYHTLRYMCISA